MNTLIYDDEDGSWGIGKEGHKGVSIRLEQGFGPEQSVLPEWAREDPSREEPIPSSSSPQAGEKRSRRRFRSNSTSSSSSISNLSEGSIDSLPSLTDSQNSLESSSEEDEEERRIRVNWLGGWQGGEWNGKSSGNGAIKGDVVERIGIRMSPMAARSQEEEQAGMSHMRKKRCSRSVGGKSSSSSHGSASSSPDPDETIRPSSTISSSSSTPSTSVKLDSNLGDQETFTQAIPSEPQRPQIEFQSLPTNFVKDSSANGKINGSRTNFVDKLVDSAVSTLEEIWSVRTGEVDCTMPHPPSSSCNQSTRHSCQQVGSQAYGKSSPPSSSGCGVTSSPSSVNSRSTGRTDSPSIYSSPASSVGSSNSDSASAPTVKESSPHQVPSISSSSLSSPPSSLSSTNNSSQSNQLPLRFFVRETLRRSKTSCSVLQTALIYCLRARNSIEASIRHSEKVHQPQSESIDQAPPNYHSSLLCQRRTFLASLILSSKFLQDKTYSNKAWSKISGLSVKELGEMERHLLKVLDYQCFVRRGEWESWCEEREKKHQSCSRENELQVNGTTLGGLKSRVGGFNRSISENVSGMELIFDTEVSRLTNLNQDVEVSRTEFNQRQSPSIHLGEGSSNSTPIASTSRDSTPTLPLPYPKIEATGAHGSDGFRPKARLPFRARSQMNPLKSASSVSSSNLSHSSPSSFGFGMEGLQLSNRFGQQQQQHPLSKSMTLTTELNRSSSDWEMLD